LISPHINRPANQNPDDPGEGLKIHLFQMVIMLGSGTFANAGIQRVASDGVIRPDFDGTGLRQREKEESEQRARL
jgi:hypothetical protein